MPVRFRCFLASGLAGLAILGLCLQGCSEQEDLSGASKKNKGVQVAAIKDTVPVPSATEPAKTPDKSGRRVDDPLILAGADFLPGLIETAEKGPFVDLLKAMDEVYTEGEIKILVAPTARNMDNVARGIVDLAFPAIRLRPETDASLPMRYSTRAYGEVTFVIYSNVNKPISRRDLKEGLKVDKFPYAVEAPADTWDFPYLPFTTFENALNKVASGRIDALVWAQEETDLVLRQMKLTNIRRELYGSYEDLFMLPRGPRGDHIDAVITRTLDRLQASGRLREIYGRIHQPYDPWQPATQP